MLFVQINLKRHRKHFYTEHAIIVPFTMKIKSTIHNERKNNLIRIDILENMCVIV